MKLYKVLVIMFCIGIAQGSSFAVNDFKTSVTLTKTFLDDFATKKSIPWMYENGLTKYNTFKEFRGNDPLTREQAAKFFMKLTELAGKTDITNTSCEFTDSKSIDISLTGNVNQVCKLGIFKGSQGKFMPKKNITRAEVIAVLMRIIYGKEAESFVKENRCNHSDCKWYSIYLDRAIALFPLVANYKDWSPSSKRDANGYYSRAEIANLLYQASQLIAYKNSEIGVIHEWNPLDMYKNTAVDLTKKKNVPKLSTITLPSQKITEDGTMMRIVNSEIPTTICFKNIWDESLGAGGHTCPTAGKRHILLWKGFYEMGVANHNINIDSNIILTTSEAFTYGESSDIKNLLDFYTIEDSNNLTNYAKTFGPIYTLKKQ